MGHLVLNSQTVKYLPNRDVTDSGIKDDGRWLLRSSHSGVTCHPTPNTKQGGSLLGRKVLDGSPDATRPSPERRPGNIRLNGVPQNPEPVIEVVDGRGLPTTG